MAPESQRSGGLYPGWARRLLVTRKGNCLQFWTNHFAARTGPRRFARADLSSFDHPEKNSLPQVKITLPRIVFCINSGMIFDLLTDFAQQRPGRCNKSWIRKHSNGTGRGCWKSEKK